MVIYVLSAETYVIYVQYICDAIVIMVTFMPRKTFIEERN